MKTKNAYWFFRAFTFSIIIIFCVAILILGSLYAYTKMNKVITGEETTIMQGVKDIIEKLTSYI